MTGRQLASQSATQLPPQNYMTIYPIKAIESRYNMYNMLLRVVSLVHSFSVLSLLIPLL